MLISGTLPKHGNTFKVCRFDTLLQAGVYTPSGSLVWRTDPLTAEELGIWLSQWGLLKGVLHPADGLKGLSFTVDDGSVVLCSPQGIVDTVTSLDSEDVFPYLLDRLDW